MYDMCSWAVGRLLVALQNFWIYNCCHHQNMSGTPGKLQTLATIISQPILTPVLERLLADVHAQLEKVVMQIFSIVAAVHLLAEVFWCKTDIAAIKRVVEDPSSKVVGSLVEVVFVRHLR